MAPQTSQKKDADNENNATKTKTPGYKSYTGDIVIAGISGRYPESDCVGEFRDNLFNKVNMITVDDRRWKVAAAVVVVVVVLVVVVVAAAVVVELVIVVTPILSLKDIWTCLTRVERSNPGRNSTRNFSI
ncbi:fatty acid synthase [Elysia marginata]|uniref:Fatty acid synthase n=1 Tax=Elysia marginata TaxID=1093978 RepID=A0AAV4FI77_9GAST|nr:fatty acid synthase [Elysia marginata]